MKAFSLFIVFVILLSCSRTHVKNVSSLKRVGPEEFFVSGEHSSLYREVLKEADGIITNENRIEYCFGDCKPDPIEGEGENYTVVVDFSSGNILYLRLRPVMEE